MLSDKELVAQFRDHYDEASSSLIAQYNNIIECEEFYAGDFMSYRDRLDRDSGHKSKKKKPILIQFNKVKPYVNAVKGWMAQNRRRSKYIARTTNKEERAFLSKSINSYADYIRENANADQHETQQDGDMLIGGVGFLETAISAQDGHASTDPNGEVIMGRIDPLSCFWDPLARSPNLIDARYIGYRKEYKREDAIELFSEAEEDDFESANAVLGDLTGDVMMRREFDWSNQQLDLVNVYFYQWYEVQNYFRAENPLFEITDPLRAQFILMRLEEIAADEYDDEDSMFNMDPRSPILNCSASQKAKVTELFDGEIDFAKFRRRCYYGSVISGSRVFSKYKLLTQQGFTIKAKTGDFDARNGIWTGMVNSMKDPVLYYNKAMTELLYTIAAGAKGGVMYEKTAIANVQQFEARYNKSDAAVEVEDGALTQGRIQPKREAFQPTGLDQIIAISDGAISDVNGIDRSFLGSSENKMETAALQRQRVKQVTSVLACYVDSVSLYQKLHARMLLDFMRVLVKANPSAMYRVQAEDGEQEFQYVNPDAFEAEYDVTTIEVSDTQAEKEERAQIILTMGRDLLAIGDTTGKLLYGLAIQDMSIDDEKKSMILQALTPQEPQIDPAYVQQLEQMVQALQGEMTQAQVAELQSRAQLNMAKIGQTQAQTDKATADTMKVIQEGKQTGIENQILRMTGSKDIRILT